jgi:hypothetical protein
MNAEENILTGKEVKFTGCGGVKRFSREKKVE